MADKKEYDEAMNVYNSLNEKQKAEAGSFMTEAAKMYTDTKDGQIPPDILKKSMEDIRDGNDPQLNLPKKQEPSLEERVGKNSSSGTLDKIVGFPAKLLQNEVAVYAAAASLLLYLVAI